jgi:hypothetical protein
VAPLHVAAREGQAALLELLLARGADPNAQDGHGWTALQVGTCCPQDAAGCHPGLGRSWRRASVRCCLMAAM